MNGREAARWYQERMGEAHALHTRYEELEQSIQASLDRVKQQEAEARLAIAQACLSELTDEGFAQAAKSTGFKGFLRRDPRKAMAQERKALERRVAEILADERYQRRQWLVGPHGELTRGLAEANELLEPWEEACARFERIDGFMELVQVNYDTPEFATPWWHPSYWRQWAAGDRICAELGMGDFGDDVLPEYRRVGLERQRWREERSRWERLIQDVHDLVREHDQAVARIPDLPRIYLESSQQVLAEFLEHADLALLDQWCRAAEPIDRELQLGLRRAAGLKAKREILDEMLTAGVGATTTSLWRRVEKYGRKATKFARPKHAGRRLSDADIDQAFVEKRHSIAQRAEKIDRLVRRIELYRDYERFDLRNEPELWWVEITGRPPGPLTPRLRQWYARRGEVEVTHDPAWQQDRRDAAVAEAAALAVVAEDVGYLS